MSKISELKLEEIIREIGLMINNRDIPCFCKDDEITLQFLKIMCSEKKMSVQEQIAFWMEHEDSIDKEKLIIVILKNCSHMITELEKKSKKLESSSSKFDQETMLEQIEIQKKQKERYDQLDRILGMARQVDTYISLCEYSEKEKRYKIDVIDSREIITGKKRNQSNKNQRELQKIDKEFQNENSEDGFGLEYVLQAFLLNDRYQVLSDISQVFQDTFFGKQFKEMLFQNYRLKNEFQEAILDEESANGVLKSLVPDIKRSVMEYANFVDIDKLLLMCAYLFQSALETGYVTTKFPNLRVMLKKISKALSKRNFRRNKKRI